MRVTSTISRIKTVITRGSHPRSGKSSIEKAEQTILKTAAATVSNADQPKSNLAWLDEWTFSQLTSHHPFVSPSTDLDSRFVQHTLGLLARNRTRMLLHCGTAEWFYDPAIGFAGAAKAAGIEIQVAESLGGFHVEGCVLPPDLGGAGARLQQTLIDFLGSDR